MAALNLKRLLGTLILAGLIFASTSASAGAAETTIGATVSQPATEAGTCGFKEARERPCLLVWTAIPGQAMTSPCDGTITRFRINGIPRPNDHYALRVVTVNGGGTFTGTATSSPVSVTTEGVNEYATSLPISAGQTIGLDFLDSTEEHGVRLVGDAGAIGGYFYAFPADGGTAPATGSANGWHYLFNADVFCTPSNAFKVLKRAATTLTVELGSAGTLAIADAAKGKAKTLKPSSAAGGPGTVAIGLKLNAAAKAKLGKTGKVKVKAKLTFTPTGGTAATQVRSFTITKKIHHRG